MGYKIDVMFPACGEAGEDKEHLSKRVRFRSSVAIVPSCASGLHGIGCPSSSSGQSQVQRYPGNGHQTLQRPSIETERYEENTCSFNQVGQRGHTLVDESGYQGLQSVVKICSSLGINKAGIGCDGNSCGFNSCRQGYVQGAGSGMVQSSDSTQRMVGVRVDNSVSPSQAEGHSSNMACRQYECQTSLVEQWNVSRPLALQEGRTITTNSLCAEHKSRPSLCSIRSASACRPDQQKEGSPRLASSKADSVGGVSNLWVARSRPNGNSKIDSGSSILLGYSGFGSSSHRRIHRRLESVQPSICFPPTSDNGVGFEQNFSMQQKYKVHCDKSMEEDSSLVSKSTVFVHVSSPQTTDAGENGAGPSSSNNSSREQIRRKDKIRRLEAYWRGRPETGRLSNGAVQTLLKSWAEGTEESYGLGFRYYSEFCQRNNLEGFTADPVTLINFLQEQFETTDKQHSTLNSYRSAVSMTLPPCVDSSLPVGQHPLVCRFMRGVHRLRPPKVKLFPTWQVSDVLQYLLSWGDAESLPLNRLLMKTAFLVALVCFKRPADLINMCVKDGYWSLNSEGFRCQPLGYGKTERHHPVPPLVIEPFSENVHLCPVFHLVTLQGKLEPLRKNEDRFWISAKKPYNAISSRTMCNWLKSVIMDSGAAGTARDVRSNGSSTAAQANLDLSRILQAGNWNRVSIFQRHYFRPQKISALSRILYVGSES